jgi:hypothetical protein
MPQISVLYPSFLVRRPGFNANIDHVGFLGGIVTLKQDILWVIQFCSANSHPILSSIIWDATVGPLVTQNQGGQSLPTPCIVKTIFSQLFCLFVKFLRRCQNSGYRESNDCMIVKSELGKMWKEEVVIELKVLCQKYSDGSEENMKTWIRTIDRESNRTPIGNKSEAILHGPTCSAVSSNYWGKKAHNSFSYVHEAKPRSRERVLVNQISRT